MMQKTTISPPDAAEVMGAYSHALKVDLGNAGMIFVTGQIAQDKNGTVVCEGDIEGQTRYVFESVQKILNAAGACLDDVVKVNIYLTNINDFAKVSPIRNEYLKNSKPVSTLVEISATVKKGCNIEIEVIAMK